MSVLVSRLIDRALVQVADPGGAHNLRTAALQAFNEMQDLIATELRVLRTDYEFDLEANEGAYLWPENRVQACGLRVARVNPPTGPGDFYPLDEIFEDEFRAITSCSRPAGEVYGYFAQPQWFELVNVPSETIPSGGIVSTYRLPTWIDVESPTTVMELPDLCRGIVVEGMAIKLEMMGRNRSAAESRWQVLNESGLLALKERIDDPSIDRRASIRPRGAENWDRGMR